MTKDDSSGKLDQFNLEREMLAGKANQAKKMTLMNDTEGTTTKVDLFKELEWLGLPSWTWNTNLPSRVSSTEIADALSPISMEECTKETYDTSTATSTQLTTSRTSNKFGNNQQQA